MVKALLSLLPLPGRERKIPGDQATPPGGRVGEAAWPEKPRLGGWHWSPIVYNLTRDSFLLDRKISASL